VKNILCNGTSKIAQGNNGTSLQKLQEGLYQHWLKQSKQGMRVDICKEAEAGRLQAQDQLGLHSETLSQKETNKNDSKGC
jgi:hypothetical protein